MVVAAERLGRLGNDAVCALATGKLVLLVADLDSIQRRRNIHPDEAVQTLNMATVLLRDVAMHRTSAVLCKAATPTNSTSGQASKRQQLSQLLDPMTILQP